MITVQFKDFDDMMAFRKADVRGYDCRNQNRTTGASSGIDTGAAGNPRRKNHQCSHSWPGSNCSTSGSCPNSTAPAASAGSGAAIYPTSAVTYTLDELARAAMSLMDSGSSRIYYSF